MRGDVRIREWLTTLVVVVLTAAGCALSEPPPPTLAPLGPCESTDGPQFKCWLDEQGLLDD